MSFCPLHPAALHPASTRGEAVPPLQDANGFCSSSAPLGLGLTVRWHSQEVANGIQHVPVWGVSLLGRGLDQLSQGDVITGKCIKRAGAGK